MLIHARGLSFTALNEKISAAGVDCTLTQCLGQRFIAAGMAGKKITIEGISGNALGAYLNGAEIMVNANAQDAVGDTMNDGKIIIHGNVGDAVGYSMRGGEIYIKGNAGYRGGIHMKEYQEKKPALIIGGRTGSFLGEYQAGGLIIVLGLHADEKPAIGDFPCTGMYGGKMFVRSCGIKNVRFPNQISLSTATKKDMESIKNYIETFSCQFGYNAAQILNEPFTLITPNSHNPYKQMYVAN